MSAPSSHRPSDPVNGRRPERGAEISSSQGPEGNPLPLDTLRAAITTVRDPDRFLRAVRSIYRAQGRPGHREPFSMAAIGSYVRFFQSKPLGMLDERHATAFLSHLAEKPGMTPVVQAHTLDALRFFHAEILHRPIGDVVPYVRAESPAGPAPAGRAGPARSLWSFLF